MKQTGKCPKCGCADIIADAKSIDRGEKNYPGEMSVATFQRPDALIFKEKRETTVSAWVCAGCGYLELYADNPQTIKLPQS